MRIYISSTSQDLADHRKRVMQVIRLLGHTPVGMEDYTASTRPPITVCLNDVETCDVYLGIVAFRYGDCPEGSEASYTELEYRRAVQGNKLRLIFMLDKNSSDYSLQSVDLVNGPKLERFRNLLLEQREEMVCMFQSREQLTEKVAKAVRDIELITPPPNRTLVKVERLPETPPTLFGRESEMKIMDEAWENPGTNVLCIVGFGGSGKSSLLNKWLNQFLTSPKYRGADAILGWSFYAGGSGLQEASADAFMDTAFQWLRESRSTQLPNPDNAALPGDPWDKGQKLAELIQARRVLLLLDGFEVLKDLAMSSLLKSLGPRNSGLCVITSRQPVNDLQSYFGGPVQLLHLSRLTTDAGIRLLDSLGVRGSPSEMAKAVEEYRGHPLSLRLVGNLLSEYCLGNVMDRGRLPVGGKLSDVVSELLRSYESRLGDAERELLRMLSVFRGPAPRRALHALRAGQPIQGLTEHVSDLSEWDWNAVESRLRKLELVSEGRAALGEPEKQEDMDSLDTHALVREHFSAELQKSNQSAWLEANNRLFEYYRKQAPDLPEDLASMMPLFRAVAHGCQAQRFQEAWDEVEWRRIRRGDEGFSVVNLGAWSEDLVALAQFFERPWSLPVSTLDRSDRATLLTETAFNLRGLSRLSEAFPPLREGLRGHVESESWASACNAAGNLSEMLVLAGNLREAADAATQSIELAEKAIELSVSADSKQKAKLTLATNIATLAEVLHQQGSIALAKLRFEQAEELYLANERPEVYANIPKAFLHRARGFHFCDLLLDLSPAALHDAEDRAAALIAIDRLVEHRKYPAGLGRLIEAHGIMIRHRNGASVDLQSAHFKLLEADTLLREAGFQPFVVRARLAMGMLQLCMGNPSHSIAELDEALEATTRGPMLLLRVDGLLEKARALLAMNLVDAARECVTAAKRDVHSTGYHRRDADLDQLWRRCMS